MRAKPAKKLRGKSAKTPAQATDSTVIKSLRLRNFLSFGPESEAVPLGPLNVLIGRNGSGKSNFLHALGVLQAIPTDVGAYLRGAKLIDEWCWAWGPRTEFTIDAELLLTPLGFQGHGAKYDLTVRNYGGLPEITERFDSDESHADTESIRDLVGEDDRRRWRTVSVLGRAQRFEDRIMNDVSDAFDSIAMIREFTFGPLSPVRQPQRADLPGHRLLEGLGNLGLILNGIRQSPASKQRFLRELNHLYDGISDFDVRVFEGFVQISLQEGKFTFPATRLSDGTLRYLGMLAVLCAIEPPPIICIEEPELGLHPDILPSIARLLVEASERSQVFVTTHSDILIDALHSNPESILVCDKEESGTVLKRLDTKRLKTWLREDYGLGDLWLRGQLGGKRW